MTADYIRLFADDSGESHFHDVRTVLASVEFAPAIPNLFVSSPFDSTTASFFGAPGGWEADWHTSSGRHLFAVLTGVWEVTASDGEVRTFAKGDVLLVEDTTGKGHASRVISQEESLALLVQLKAHQS
jgi:quercetin dioxygenase-like cupin family protein